MKMWHLLAAAALAVLFSGAALAECEQDHAAPSKTSAVQTPAAKVAVSHLA